jgi:GT2 family glycosyltransferase
MLGYAMQENIGAVGAKLLYPNQTVQHGGVLVGVNTSSHAFVDEPFDSNGIYGRLAVPYNYSAVTAAAMMLETRKFKLVGGLEETLKVAYNDIDLCLKLLNQGFYNVFLPQVMIMHHESYSRGLDTTPDQQHRFQTEVEYMRKHWSKYMENDPAYNPNYSKEKSFVLDKKSNF